MEAREIDWEAILRSAAELQKLVPGTILVGGTAAALHAGHRRSEDADHVLGDLQGRFETLLAFLEGRADWVTHRIRTPVLILGAFRGVETGLRQLARKKPLETTVVETPAGPVRVPTAEEMVRVKAWLALRRNATRDYIDLAALTRSIGEEATRRSLLSLDECYADVYRPEADRDVSPLLQLARQLAEPQPTDLADTDVANYKGIAKTWASWSEVAAQCRSVAVAIGEMLTEGR